MKIYVVQEAIFEDYQEWPLYNTGYYSTVAVFKTKKLADSLRNEIIHDLITSQCFNSYVGYAEEPEKVSVKINTLLGRPAVHVNRSYRIKEVWIPKEITQGEAVEIDHAFNLNLAVVLWYELQG